MIRLMKEQDMPVILDIWLAGNLQAHPFIPAAYWQENLGKMEREYLPDADVFVYEDEETRIVKGFIGIVDDSFIAGLFVLPAYQGQGIGKALLIYCQEKYASLGLNVYCKNEKAIRFYERNGFQVSAQGVDEATEEREQTMVWKK